MGDGLLTEESSEVTVSPGFIGDGHKKAVTPSAWQEDEGDNKHKTTENKKLSTNVKGLSRSKVIETIAVDIDAIDIGEPLSNELITTTTTSPLPPPLQLPVIGGSESFNGGLVNGGIVQQDEERMNGEYIHEVTVINLIFMILTFLFFSKKKTKIFYLKICISTYRVAKKFTTKNFYMKYLLTKKAKLQYIKLVLWTPHKHFFTCVHVSLYFRVL